ncbi:MAG: NADPH-dependent 7-cyano-7-deazaguanine reductase QueF [Pseudomonadales bacterium]|nr:NADPH-dependent 7-cyano-7-deazaguanine reductase QueF [Pseudomonadales bacterium]
MCITTGDFGSLGSETNYNQSYDPAILVPINRQENRASLKPDDSIFQNFNFSGHDQWTVYEASWLNFKGRPLCAILDIHIPADSPNTVESKSLKLYLNSLNQQKFDSPEKYTHLLCNDLSGLCGAPVEIHCFALNGELFASSTKNTLGNAARPLATAADDTGYLCLDTLDIALDSFQPTPALLSTKAVTAEKKLCSHLFRSNCPVTNQPDWASIFVSYSGPEIEPESLLAYLCSYRQHMGFHEHCIEQIFLDLLSHCQCKKLSVEGRFLRRGGIDINPFRSNCNGEPLGVRMPRQ